jgi:hypothetical protein
MVGAKRTEGSRNNETNASVHQHLLALLYADEEDDIVT